MMDAGFVIFAGGKTMVEQGRRALDRHRLLYCWISQTRGTAAPETTRSAAIVLRDDRGAPREVELFDPLSALHAARFDGAAVVLRLRDGSEHRLALAAAPDLVLGNNLLLMLGDFCATRDRSQAVHKAKCFSLDEFALHDLTLEPRGDHDWHVSGGLLLSCDGGGTLIGATSVNEANGASEQIGARGPPILFDPPLQQLRARADEAATPRMAISGITREEVVIDGDDVALHGLLVRPATPREWCVFVSGSGPVTRWGTVRGIHLTTLAAMDALAAAGVACLAIDSRGAGATGYGDIARTLREARRADALAATRWLSRHGTDTPRPVAAIGHSLGALIVLEMLAVADPPPLERIVLLAPPGRRLRDILIEQNETESRRLGVPQDAIAAQTAAFKTMLSHYAEVPPGIQLLSPLALADPALLDADPLTLAERIRQPVLVLQGGKDFQVSAQLDAQALVTRLASLHREVSYELIPDADHLFRQEPEVSTPQRYRLDLPAHPDYLRHLVRFLAGRGR